MKHGWACYGALLVLGALLDVVCRPYPADLPIGLPWEFSWPEYLATALTLGWFARGLKVLPKAEHPPLWRMICFVAGVASFWIVLETRIDYYAQHMFFVHRAAHFVLHHLGAFLIALGMGGPVLFAGMPDYLKPMVPSRTLLRTLAYQPQRMVVPHRPRCDDRLEEIRHA